METKKNTRKSLKTWIVEDLLDDFRTWRGQLIGAIIGYVVSFFFQNELVTQKMGFAGYITHPHTILFEMAFDKVFCDVAVIGWAGVVVGMLLGKSSEKQLVKKGIIKPCGKKQKKDQDAN